MVWQWVLFAMSSIIYSAQVHKETTHNATIFASHKEWWNCLVNDVILINE